MKKKKTNNIRWIAALVITALALFACTEEDLVQPANGDTAALRIASVTIDGQQTARTRAAYDGTDETNSPYNRTIAAFTTGDVMNVWYHFGDDFDVRAYATLGADGTWAMTSDEAGNTPVTIKPGQGEFGSQKWKDASMQAQFYTFADASSLLGEAALAEAEGLGAVQGTIPTENISLMADNLYATTSSHDQQNYGCGTITIDTDVKSPTLGTATIELRHYGLALLRLPVEAVSIAEGTYIVNGTAYNVTGLGTLWAEVSRGYGDLDGYYPLTKVKIGEEDYLQAIVPALPDGYYTLTGFKAVMKVTDSSGASATSSNLEEESVTTTRGISNSPSKLEATTTVEEALNMLPCPKEGSTVLCATEACKVPEGGGSLSTRATSATITLDLPFTVGTEQAEASVPLQPNTRYPLTLTIAPTRSTVTLTDPLGKPGWGTDEEELSNLLNELDDMIVTIDDTPYLRLDPTQTTDVATVKTLLRLAIEQKGITHLCVTGETLTAYDGDDAKTVVGEAIYTGEFADGTLTLLLPDATAIAEKAFDGCHALASVSAPKATEIGAYAFVNCCYLASISAPEALTIGDYAFTGCHALTSVELPKVTTIGGRAFENINSRPNIVTTLTSIELPAATTIGERAFLNCGNLESVSLPSATEIGAYAFEGCGYLESVSMPSATEIGAYAFSGCTLTSVEFPSIITIGSNAFSGSNIASLSLPKVTEIGAYAFSGCTLTSVEFPSIITIGSNAFSGCFIASLSFGTVIESVGTDAFSDTLSDDETDWTTTCDLTLAEGQTVGNPDVENKKWLDLTWQSITLKNTNE